MPVMTPREQNQPKPDPKTERFWGRLLVMDCVPETLLARCARLSLGAESWPAH